MLRSILSRVTFGLMILSSGLVAAEDEEEFVPRPTKKVPQVEQKTSPAEQRRWAILQERRLATRRAYAKFPVEILGVREPIQIDEAVMYDDGGTRMIKFTDATGRKFAACLDNRDGMYNHDEDYRLYWGSADPADPKSQCLQWRGLEESAIYGLLLRWKAALHQSPKSPRARATDEEKRRDYIHSEAIELLHGVEGHYLRRDPAPKPYDRTKLESQRALPQIGSGSLWYPGAPESRTGKNR